MKEVEGEVKGIGRRMLALIPLNFMMLYGTFKYPRFLSDIARRTIYKGRNPNTALLLLLDVTSRAMIAATIISSNLLVLGVNPLGLYQRFRQ